MTKALMSTLFIAHTVPWFP